MYPEGTYPFRTDPQCGCIPTGLILSGLIHEWMYPEGTNLIELLVIYFVSELGKEDKIK